MNSTMLLLASISAAGALFARYKVNHPGRPKPWSHPYNWYDVGAGWAFTAFFLVFAFILR